MGLREYRMSVYKERVLPHLINWACGNAVIEDLRRELVPLAAGRVLEVGIGPGINLPFYDPSRVEQVWGLEPSRGMRRKAQSRLASAPFEVQWLDLPGEEIPLDDSSVDTVLLTFTLCTIPDWRRALEQMRRVLKPGGQLIFCEHGASPDGAVQRWQNRINPLWKTVCGGCNINRPMDQMLREAGFRFQRLDTGYMRNTPRIAGFLYRGLATPCKA